MSANPELAVSVNPQQQQPRALDFALDCLARGIRVIPLYPRQKRPIDEGWQNLRLDAEQLRTAFTNGENLGILLGEPSGGLADIDLDCDEALTLQQDYLPHTEFAFGRGGHITHRVFRVTPGDFATAQFRDPAVAEEDQKSTLVELRGTGAQTMAPPSVHPDTAQTIEWYAQGDPYLIEHAELLKRVERLAAASLLARYWPPVGGRNHAGLALAGALANAGWSELEVIEFINPIAEYKGDKKTQEVKSTFKRILADKPATGQPTCAEVFGEKVWTRVAEWLHLKQPEAHVWSDPIPLDIPSLPPLDESVFDPAPWLRGMAEAVAKATETPFELAAIDGLGAVAAAVQKKVIVQVRLGYHEPLSIYANAALESGNRKTAVMELMTAPLLAWEAEQIAHITEAIRQKKSERETAEARIKEKRICAAKAQAQAEADKLSREIVALEAALPEVPRVPQLWAQDVTPEALGSLMADNGEHMALISDEAGIFEIIGGRYSNGIPNLDLFLKAHSGSPFRVNRGSRPPVMMRAPALTMVVSSQPEILSGLASKQHFRGSGLLARFLYMLPVSRLGYRDKGKAPTIEPSVLDCYNTNLRALLNLSDKRNAQGELEPCILELDDDARTEWLAFDRMVEPELRDGGRYEFIKDWAGKLPGAAIRIAGLIHCAQHAGTDPSRYKLSKDTMSRALDFAAVLSEHALAVFDLMGADPALKGARKVWAWIERNSQPQFAFRDAYQALRGSFPRAEDIEPAFAVLIERDYIALRESGSPRGRGRPSRTYEVNPTVVAAWRGK